MLAVPNALTINEIFQSEKQNMTTPPPRQHAHHRDTGNQISCSPLGRLETFGFSDAAGDPKPESENSTEEAARTYNFQRR